jgi:alkylation response protein AidB-like acyl-CoA dehydrogenase
LVGAEGDGFKIAMAGLDGGRLYIGACAIGGAQRRWTRRSPTCASARRSGGGSPISRPWRRRHRDLPRGGALAVWRASSALDEKSPEAIRLCGMAKRVATDAGFNAANDALQLLGGYGYLADYGVEKLVRDVRVHQILERTSEIMRVIVARGLIEN